MTVITRIRSVPCIVMLSIFALTSLPGCATRDVKWQHETLAQEEWDADAAQCKWEARQKAEKEYQQTASQNQQDSYEDSQSVDSMLASADVNKRTRTLFNRCMKLQGYVEVE